MQYCGKEYDLNHLAPCTMQFERPAKDGMPPVIYSVDVNFSTHCFSRKIAPGESYEKALECFDGREVRLFDPARWELSHYLPEILRQMGGKKCRHTGHGNYLSVEVLQQDGGIVEYDIFFRVRKPAKRRLSLYVESAYVRDPQYKSNRPYGKPVAFLVTLHNTLHGKRIRD